MVSCKDINLKDNPMPFSQNQQREFFIFKSLPHQAKLISLARSREAFPLVVCYFNVVCRRILLPPPPSLCVLAPSVLGAAESREADTVKGPGERERERELL